MPIGKVRIERRVLNELRCQQFRNKIANLVRRNRIAQANIDSPTILETSTPVDANDFALKIEQRPARVARVDRAVDLNAIAIHQLVLPCSFLVAFYSTDDAQCHRWFLVFGQDERIAHRQSPVADANGVGVT